MTSNDDDKVIITNRVLWEELRTLRQKVDALQSRIMFIFGGFSAITASMLFYQILSNNM